MNSLNWKVEHPNIFRRIVFKVEDILKCPFVRYSRIRNHIVDVFSYSETEKNLRQGFRFFRINGLEKDNVAYMEEGDYAEFGVFRGASFIASYHLAQLEKQEGMKFYAFDTFSGLPKPRSTDTNFTWEENDFSCSLEEFKKNLKKKGVDMNKVICIKGKYEDTLKYQHNPRKLSFIHIDCDYYSSSKDVFNYIGKYLQEGTIILFDDWYCFKGSREKGVQKAFNEFLEENKNIIFADFPTQGLKKMVVCLEIKQEDEE